MHMKFALYNVTSIRGFNYMLSVVCANNIMLWIFPTLSKQAPLHRIRLILSIFNN